MSAIWGYLNLDAFCDSKNKVKEIEEKMNEAYTGYAIDRFGKESFDIGFFACGIQNFTKRAENEVLPIFDRDNQIVFTADIVLNSRDLLITEIAKAEGIESVAFLKDMPDGMLAYKAYLIWKEKFVDHIQGIFAIAIYDIEKENFYIFSDQMGNRSITYALFGREIYFSTLPQIIYNILPDDRRFIDEKWIAGCESSSCPGMCMFPGLTPFKNIKQLVRGRCLKISCGKKNARELEADTYEYWNPLRSDRHSKWVTKEKSYYRNAFRKVYFECIKDCLDSDGEIAVTLSSGLDSSSVATIAASILKDEGKKLYSFTSVPLKDYKSDLGAEVITDESAGVKHICDKYENIVPEFIDCDGKSPFTEAERLVMLTATPSKSLSNEVWIDEINRRAAKKGCKMLLIGHYGNLTVSNGRVLARVYQELKGGHLFEAKRQLAAYGKRYGVTRKELLRGTVSEGLKELSFRLSLNRDYNDSFDFKYLKPELMKRYNIIKAQKEIFRKEGYSELVSREQACRFILDELLAQEISISDTASSLRYGILTRDPTRDKRIVELMVSFSPDQFTDDGLERRLIRDYLDDYIPDDIRLESRKRGRQGADLVLRLLKFGEMDVSANRDADIYKYFDYENVQKLVEEEITEKNAFDKVRVMSLDVFLKSF